MKKLPETRDFQRVVDENERDARPATQILTSVPVGVIFGKFGNPLTVPAEEDAVVFSDGEKIPVEGAPNG